MNRMSRPEHITQTYLAFIDQHLADILSGAAAEMLELNEIAAELHISRNHLSDTIKAYTGHHPCFFYDQKILDIAKTLLRGSAHSVADIARMLTYDPSNFSKFFKKFEGKTPGMFRKEAAQV
ncbi:AraC family transcriptional regulator [Taibaiella sp. KBW10]|uniref:helix-turn-helix domain-containing protein n=1 Tax=Taibaiella sp. KBW10 TaxID=2153357 RepID=UPI000F591AED|nr:AraC family transcriptional regulator [Taibaiella sp. KBW10]RQO29920.1 AraC family transcriptional regulator [Taibaiella sp. KBW10]